MVVKPPSLPPLPPPKPRRRTSKAPEKGLHEVEQAISLLEGRHPEHERSRRETAAAVEARRRALEAELAERARGRRKRAVLTLCVVLAAAAAGGVVWKLAARTISLRAAIERASAPFVARDFATVASNDFTGSAELEADVAGASCLVAVSDAPTLRVSAGGVQTDGGSSVMWCSCAPGHVSIEAVGRTRPALGLLRVDARAVGGPLARPWSDVDAGTWAGGGDECGVEMVDAWIAAGHWPKPQVDDSWLDASPARAPLRRAGFHVVSLVAEGKPFAVVDAAAGACSLGIAASSADKLSLRPPGAATVVAGATGVLAWCDAPGTELVLQREGKSAVVVVSAPGVRIGGLLGVREVAAEAHLSLAPGAVWLRESDLAWDASAVLRASGVPDVGADAIPAAAGTKVGARIVALSLAVTADLAHDPSSVAVPCDRSSDSRQQVCAPAAPVAWWRKTDAPAALAHGGLPFWLTSFESRLEPDALARIPELLALARRLMRGGFEPTVFEGVTELADGVRVVGRAGEDAVVAVGLAPKPPWVFPYTNRVAWDLGDEPRVVTLRPGDGVKLVTSPPSTAPVDKRRTVVFRRAALP